MTGIVFNPSFVAKYVKQVETLHPSAVSKVLSYQLYIITLGFLVIFVSALIYSRRYVKILSFPLLITYLLLVYGFYINKRYPENIILKPSELVKTWHVLLGKELVVNDYQPKSALVTKNREIKRAKYPVIDIHFHLGSLTNLSVNQLVKAMDACGITKVVNLDGGARLEEFIKDFRNEYPDRFIMFAQLNLSQLDDPNFAGNQTALLIEKVVNFGAQGLKVPKDLGLGIKDRSGRLIPVDDPRLDPIWSKAGELGIPVLIHTADPTPFFQPVNRFNERYEELSKFPEWSYYSPYFPSKETLLAERENLLRKHPKTIFIGAHMGMSPANLSYVGYLLNNYPNYYVDISSVLSDLGRQPYTAREFFIRYQDRILFGTDGGYALGTNGWSAERFFRKYFEFLETDNEYFGYPLWDITKQGKWRIYGINLPDEVLKKVYYNNAAKVLGLNKVSYKDRLIESTRDND